MENSSVERIRILSQQYAYTSLVMHETIASEVGLSGTDQKYLGFLLKYGTMTAGELAGFSGLTSGAVTGLIDRFEKKNLVRRVLSTKDRRKIIIEPNTDYIISLFEPLYKDFHRKIGELTATFSNSEIKGIESYLSESEKIMREIAEVIIEKRKQ